MISLAYAAPFFRRRRRRATSNGADAAAYAFGADAISDGQRILIIRFSTMIYTAGHRLGTAYA